MVAKLFLKSIGDTILFVFAITARGPIILMCSNLNFCPIKAQVGLYCISTLMVEKVVQRTLYGEILLLHVF